MWKLKPNSHKMQNNENSPKPVSLPGDLSKPNLMKPLISLANDFTMEFRRNVRAANCSSPG
jgi:hypothetical protein